MVRKQFQDGLNACIIAVYGFGHAFNDLAVAMWFNYAIYFFSKVMGISAAFAGGIMLIG